MSLRRPTGGIGSRKPLDFSRLIAYLGRRTGLRLLGGPKLRSSNEQGGAKRAIGFIGYMLAGRNA